MLIYIVKVSAINDEGNSQDYPQIRSLKSMVKTARMTLGCKICTIYYNTCIKYYLLTLITTKT